VHGYARRSEDRFIDNDKLHAWCDEVKRKNKRRISELAE